jgi:hypothetical protein
MLFALMTIRLLGQKYVYYKIGDEIASDSQYDAEREGWHKFGLELGILTEDETDPCIDFDENHPLADVAIAWAKTIPVRR